MPEPSTPQCVISAFPATGKSYVATTTPSVIDSDSSACSWKQFVSGKRVRHPDWPANYMARIRRAAPAIILVSTHSEIRAALENAGVWFTLVYPEAGLREEYRERMERRGSPQALIEKVIDVLWGEALAECAAQSGCDHVVLGPGQYLADVLP